MYARLGITANIAILTWIGVLAACAAQTRYRGVPAAQLTDGQLVEEIVSAAQGLGVAVDRNMYLIAIRPEPAYVLTSSTTTFSGTMTATYNAYSMPVGYSVATSGQVRGSVSGVSTTRYTYTDVNAAARLGNSIAIAINRSREAAYRARGQEVLAEYQRRVEARRTTTERMINAFFAANPDLANRPMLVAAVAPWAAAEQGGDGQATLRRSKEIIQALRRGPGLSGTWYGMFSQTTKTDQGEVFAFSEFVRVELSDDTGVVTGRGVLGSGEVIELNGRVTDSRLSATVANITSAINVTVTGIAAASQITAEFEGFGAGQRMTGTAVLLR